MRRIYWDTMLYAYWMEGHAEFGPRIEAIRESMNRRGDRLCASALICAEVLVGPTITKDLAAARAIEAFFASPEVEILPFPLQASPVFARLRLTASNPRMRCTWRQRRTPR